LRENKREKVVEVAFVFGEQRERKTNMRDLEKWGGKKKRGTVEKVLLIVLLGGG